MDPLQIGPVLLFALSLLGTARVRVETSPAAGLGPETGVGRLDPSDIFSMGDSRVVLYTRTTASRVLYPSALGGEIWWAASVDGGLTWAEKSRVLGTGNEEREDSNGVFDPTVTRGPDGSLYLFYAGVGPRFNPRFERQSRPGPTTLFVARLELDQQRGTIRATRLSPALGILAPSPAIDGAFDSLRVRPSVALQRNGLTYIYYQGLAFLAGTDHSPLGLAIADTPLSPLRRAHQGRTVLPFDGDALLGHHEHGIFALFTGADRGLWWAPDGEHFAPLEARVSGRLNSPGLFRDGAQQRLDAENSLWGLHVARKFPDPYLERFDLRLEGPLVEPLDSTVPIPGSHKDPSWPAGSSWMGQHTLSRAQAKLAQPRYAFLGDDLVEGFGGHERSSNVAGQAAWDSLFEGRVASNLGLRGDCSANVIWRVDHGALPAGSLHTILLQVGANQLDRESAKSIAAGVGALLQRLRARFALAEIVLTSIPRTPAMSEEEAQTLGKLNRLLARLALQPQVRYVDLAATFGAAQREVFDSRGEGLSAVGYRAWVKVLEPILTELEESAPENAAEHLKRKDK